MKVRTIIISLFVAVLALSVASLAQNTTKPTVTVVNADSQPVPTKVMNTTPLAVSVTNAAALPVSGSVNVANFPAVQPVSGTVNLGNLPAVQPVSGTVDIGKLPAQQSVFSITDVAKDPSFSSCCETHMYSTNYEIPEGKTLVIEQVFGSMGVPPGTKVMGSVVVITATTNSVFWKYVPMHFEYDATLYSKDYQTCNMPLKLRLTNPAGSGQTLSVSGLLRPQTTDPTAYGEFGFSGYLEPAP